jgi:glycosyltransferase involved in cell wall biosynthesis
MRLLLSTYACSPHHGSEHSVGWNWATEASRQGHEVWALASPVHRSAIEAACRNDSALRRIHWFFPEVPFWRLSEGHEPQWERSYNLLWQIQALRQARALRNTVRFDLSHHLTWGGVRAPTFLGAVDVPMIMGPFGGGETSPKGLRDVLRPKARLTEWIRDLSNATISVNPIVRAGLRAAAILFVKTPDTQRLLTPREQAKSICFLELSLRSGQLAAPRPARQGPKRLLFVGRLLYWKGAHIAVQAFSELLAHEPDAQLTIVGKGPELDRLKAQAAATCVAGSVHFIPWLQRDAMHGVYDRHDLFVFPSLHDSSGTVVLEAMARGLPVVCLDVGGPAQIVSSQSGILVATSGRSTAQVASAMADEMAALLAAPSRLTELSAGCVAAAGEYLLHRRVAAFYAKPMALLGISPQPGAGEGECLGAHRNIATPEAVS